jgi:hypothetical protein
MRLDRDTDEIKRLEDAAFISRRDPYSAAQKIAEPFRQLLRSRGSLLEKEFGIESSAAAKGLRFLSDCDEIAYISDSKIVDNLLKDMKDLRLVILKRRGSGTGDWLGMHSGLARVYMTALAETMAPDIGARPLADNPLDHAAISGVTMERLVDVLLGCREPKSNLSTEIEVSIATLAFRQVVPQGITNIPVSDIIKFREDYGEDRIQFRDEIEKMLKDMDYLRDVKKPEDLARHLESAYQNRIKGKLERLEKAMKRANWDVVDSALAAS